MSGTFGALSLTKKELAREGKEMHRGKWPCRLRLCNSQERVDVGLSQACVQNLRKTDFRDSPGKSLGPSAVKEDISTERT